MKVIEIKLRCRFRYSEIHFVDEKLHAVFSCWRNVRLMCYLFSYTTEILVQLIFGKLPRDNSAFKLIVAYINCLVYVVHHRYVKAGDITKDDRGQRSFLKHTFASTYSDTINIIKHANCLHENPSLFQPFRIPISHFCPTMIFCYKKHWGSQH